MPLMILEDSGETGVRLPNGEAAIVAIEKIRDYCLSTTHPRGRHEARVFLATLGITAAQSEELRQILLQAARDYEAQEGASDQYGRRYIIDFDWTRAGKAAAIRSFWIVLADESVPRFTTCYVL